MTRAGPSSRRKLGAVHAAAFLAAWAAGALMGCNSPSAELQKARMVLSERDSGPVDPSRMQLRLQERAQRALRHYLNAIEMLEKDDSPQAQVMRARAYKGAADVYYLELRDMKQALGVYRELVQQCPESLEALQAHIVLADLLQNYFRDPRGAIAELEAAIARNPPQSAELTYQVAKLYFELGDYPQCELEVKRMLAKFETSSFLPDAMFLRAQALGMIDGRQADASKAFEELVRRFPDSELAPHAMFELGKLKSEMGEDEKAIELWVESLKRHPDPAVVQSSIARVRARIVHTTPSRIGDHGTAFDRSAARRRPPPKTSIEAVGGSEEEAKRDVGD